MKVEGEKLRMAEFVIEVRDAQERVWTRSRAAYGLCALPLVRSPLASSVGCSPSHGVTDINHT